jgi:clan AA aspartic protease
MGITYIEGEVSGPAGKERVRFLVDSGVAYTLLPLNVWRAIGLTPKRTMEFVLADGTTIQRGVSECHIVLPQGEGHTPVILGEESDEALLGIVTLEILGLVFNPLNRTLQPLRMRLVKKTTLFPLDPWITAGGSPQRGGWR